jgi:hypothetical protein
MMFRTGVLIMAASLYLAGLPGVAGAADPDMADDEYAVYSALLSPARTGATRDRKAGQEEKRLAAASRKKRPDLGALGGKVLVVSGETRSGEMLDKQRVGTVESPHMVGPAVKLGRELIDDYNSKNKGPHRLSERFAADKKVVLLSKEESAEIFNRGGWDEFYRRYPDSAGLLAMSRVGFNAGRDTAFLYVGSSSGPRSGAGCFVLLQKSKASGRWYIVKHIPLWVS